MPEPQTNDSFNLNCIDSNGNTIEILITDFNILVDNVTYDGTVSRNANGTFSIDGITDENIAHSATITIHKEGYSQYTFTVSLADMSAAAVKYLSNFTSVNVTLNPLTLSDRLHIISDAKKAIKAAIEAKGVTDVGDKIADYAGKIESIESGGLNDIPVFFHVTDLANKFTSADFGASYVYKVVPAITISNNTETLTKLIPTVHRTQFCSVMLPKTSTTLKIDFGKEYEKYHNYYITYALNVINSDLSITQYPFLEYNASGTEISAQFNSTAIQYFEVMGLDLSNAIAALAAVSCYEMD